MKERIVYLRNELLLWTLGRKAISLEMINAHIIELDNLLQLVEYRL